jgi:hypothetical protein
MSIPSMYNMNNGSMAVGRHCHSEYRCAEVRQERRSPITIRSYRLRVQHVRVCACSWIAETSPYNTLQGENCYRSIPFEDPLLASIMPGLGWTEL